MQFISDDRLIDFIFKRSAQGMLEIDAATRGSAMFLKMTFKTAKIIWRASTVGVETGNDSILSAVYLIEAPGCFIHPYLPRQADTGVFRWQIGKVEQMKI